MRTITFYSYKGGMGRTLMAANFGVYLAKLGKKAILVDFDLESPGLDSKFRDLALQNGQKGLLDYLLHFQETGNDDIPIEDVTVDVPIHLVETGMLRMIPAGDYLNREYSMRLNRLDWSKIFSEERQGVAFFQQFLKKIEVTFAPDFLIVDSRTGISEIGGVCTQILADEVVLLSNLSAENIKMTKLMAIRIGEDSEIAKLLGKKIDVEVVVSRVPKPEEGLEEFKEKCSNHLKISPSYLFFLFSSRALEEEEFVVMDGEMKRDEELTQGYLRLFSGMNIDLADTTTQKELGRIGQEFLTKPDMDIEKRLEELAVLLPHLEIYRAGMRLFYRTKESEKLRTFGSQLKKIIPDDLEADQLMISDYIRTYESKGYWQQQDKENLFHLLNTAWQRNRLDFKELFWFATFLYDAGDYRKCFDVLWRFQKDSGGLPIEMRLIYAKSAFRSGHPDSVLDTIRLIPVEEADVELSRMVVQHHLDIRKPEQAFEWFLYLLKHDLLNTSIHQAAAIAKRAWSVTALEIAVRQSEEFQKAKRDKDLRDKLKEEFKTAELDNLVKELELESDTQ
ncbi:AAA family ATPase [Candidatus Poribacteria bacterium]|nr:AAA family ATPase [Candidatus Poribacteria bacterium]